MKVSIIITSYNYEQYIQSCIESCLNQNRFDDYEVLLVDDGSSDNTLNIAKEFDDKIRIFSNSNNGLEYSCNYALSKAKGDYIVRVDADDKLNPDYLSLVYETIKLKKVGFVYSEYQIIDASDEIIENFKLPVFNENEIKERGDFLATGTLYDVSYLKRYGYYSNDVKNCGLENYELILKLLKNNIKGFCIHSPLFQYRHHQSNMSMQKREAIIKYGEKLASNNFLDKYKTNKNHPYGLVL